MPEEDSGQIQGAVLIGTDLSIPQVERVARHHEQIQFSPETRKKVIKTADIVGQLATTNTPVYGLNTGFGIFANQRIEPALSQELSQNLILSHAAGLGDPFPEEVVRAGMLIRANTLAGGYSGVRVEVIETLIAMLNNRVTPVIPSRGSLGSSGDLAPLAHLAIVLADTSPSGETGEAWYKKDLLNGDEAMARAEIPRVRLGPKEGLALINGATFSAALLALACADAEKLMGVAVSGAALSLEALLGVSGAFDERMHNARPHSGQVAIASQIRNLVRGSGFIDSSNHIHDAYSLRCIPQILGPALEILEFVKGVVSLELNAATDNPLLFGEEVLSGGNFHGEPLGLAADYLKIALAEVGSISERRIFRLTAEHTNLGLPPMLVADVSKVGLHSGLMMLQYTAAALVMEMQSLANPDSTRSIPTSAGQEDHNANSATAARNLRKVIELLTQVIAIELVTAAQALDLRMRSMPETSSGEGTISVFNRIRQVVTFISEDRPLSGDIEEVEQLIRDGEMGYSKHV